jgi:Tyrosyl-DNA phosphodiesterase
MSSFVGGIICHPLSASPILSIMSKRPLAEDEQHHAQTYLDQLKQSLQGPSLTVDGIQYFSDRFYLNHVVGVDPPDWPPTTSVCTCGAQQAPPLFSRERLLKSLSLKAVVMGTFTLDEHWLRRDLPKLFGHSATVPTLVVHGDKKLKRERKFRQQVQGEIDSDDQSIFELESRQPAVIPGFGANVAEHSHCQSANAEIPVVEFPTNRPVDSNGSESQEKSVDGGCLLETHVQDEKSAVRLSARLSQIDAITEDVTFDTACRKKAKISLDVKQRPLTTAFRSDDFGKHCHFTSIESNWKKAGELENRGVSAETRETTIQKKRGVHHPKFMILFETSGSVVVVVSTANLVQTKTVEGSWVQRFFPSKRKGTSAHPGPSRLARSNDFGPALQDFLQKLDDSAASGETKIQDFLLEHLSLPLTKLADSFLFHRAQVHLVPVVPGDFSVKSEAYGRLKVQAILRRARLQRIAVEHKSDHLFLQPTSFGGNWKQKEMADIVRSYLTLDRTTEGYWDDEKILERMSILWPSRSFIENLGRVPGNYLPLEEVERIPIPSKGATDDDSAHDAKLFMSSHCFNSCEVGCISRMSFFHWSDPPQHASYLIPHFKSACRVIRKPALIRSQHGFDDSAKVYFSWFLMTSACLSHGAQGQRDRFSESNANTIRFANFELGILFTSRVDKSSHLLYAFKPQKCSCRSVNPKRTIIHLPVPFSVRSDPYLPTSELGEDAFVMKETPFLHQLEAGTQCTGNMMLTPYGIQQAMKTRVLR